MITDIRHPEVLIQIGKMVSSGMTFSAIAKNISETFKIHSSPTVIKKTYEIYVARRNEVLQGDLQLKENVKQEILNWKDQLAKMNKMVWEMIENAETEGIKLDAMKEVRQQLDLQNKILSRMEDSFNNQVVNRIQITRDVINVLDKLEKDGMIKILRLPGQIINLTKEEPKQTEPGTAPELEFIDSDDESSDSSFLCIVCNMTKKAAIGSVAESDNVCDECREEDD